jgi:crotonobetainyl-CoA:carnitine CoA-transferase CaiB-like acyl-CoA transferase
VHERPEPSLSQAVRASAIISPVASTLEAIRVVELSEALAGPYCAMLLGDMGADVIKVERPGTGDQTRGWGPPFVGTESAYFLGVNRNKRSITLNYDDARDSALLHQLMATADVLVSNQASLASMQKRGLDPETVRGRYPRLVHANISSYGLAGPRTGRPGYDIMAQAEAGVMTFTGEPAGEPMRYPIAIADMTCGMYAAMGILAALFARERTGRGQFLDMALFDSQLTWLANVGSNYLNADVLPQRWGNAHPSIVPYQMFRGSDAKYLVVAVGTEPLWKKFVQALNAENTMGADPRFLTNTLRIAHRSELISALQAQFAEEPASVWLDRLTRAGVPSAPINSVPEALSEAQVRERGLIVQIEHPSLGIVRSIANPITFSDTPVSYRLPPPLLGEHTAQILQELESSSHGVRPAESRQL